MITTIKTPTYNTFFNLVKDAHEEIVLCAPFIKTTITNKIIKDLNKNVKLTIVTSSNLPNFIHEASDVNAIKTFLNNGIKVLNYQGLHAKIYLFDNKKALVTSANMTYHGMNENYEYGLFIEDDNLTINKIIDDLNLLFKDDNCSIFKKEDIENIEKCIKDHKNTEIGIDETGELILVFSNEEDLLKDKTGWIKETLRCLLKINNNNFELKDIYAFKDYFSKMYPNNNTIEDKIRQQLQYLRNMGLISFIEKGKYKKLWKIK